MKRNEIRFKGIVLTFVMLITSNNISSQEEIVGRVNFYKSSDTKERVSMSTTDSFLNSLNSQSHNIELSQNGHVIELETDSTGFFRFPYFKDDSLKIVVNNKSEVLNKAFYFDKRQFKDSIELNISDKKMALYLDSIAEPHFYKTYNESIARNDFENGKRQILVGGGIISDENFKRREKISKEYHLNYKVLFGCEGNINKLRIAYRYNEVMKNLIGIKNE